MRLPYFVADHFMTTCRLWSNTSVILQSGTCQWKLFFRRVRSLLTFQKRASFRMDGQSFQWLTLWYVCIACKFVSASLYWCHSSSCLQLYTLLQIAERDANKFKEGKWIPQCELMMKWKRDNEEPGRLEYKVILNGAREDKNYLHLVLDPREGSPHDELCKWCTVSYW